MQLDVSYFDQNVSLHPNQTSPANCTDIMQFSGGAPTACTYTVSGSISLPSTGFFSPFPHGTGSLSVSQEYLALEDGPPLSEDGSVKISRVPTYSISLKMAFRVRGYHPLLPHFPERSAKP